MCKVLEVTHADSKQLIKTKLWAAGTDVALQVLKQAADCHKTCSTTLNMFPLPPCRCNLQPARR